MNRYSPAADVKATSYMAPNGDGAYYLASEVDARIADLKAALRNIADPNAFHTIAEMRAIAKSVL